MIFLIVVSVIVVGFLAVCWLAGLKAESDIKKEFAKSIEKSFNNVKKYCSKFKASIDHLDSILNAFTELTEGGGLKYLKQYEGYKIPTKDFHFLEKFYILVDENLRYKLIITVDDINFRDEFNDISPEKSAANVKKYLPYAKTLDEFKKFVEECHIANQEAELEKNRRKHVNNVIRKNVK